MANTNVEKALKYTSKPQMALLGSKDERRHVTLNGSVKPAILSDKGIERLTSFSRRVRRSTQRRRRWEFHIAQLLYAMNNGANDAPNHKSHSGARLIGQDVRVYPREMSV